MFYNIHRSRIVTLISIIFTALLGVAWSAKSTETVTLRWDQNPESDIAGYRLHYGTASGNYNETLEVGNMTTVTVSALADTTTYFFVVTAYNTAGLESLPSNEASFTPVSAGALVRGTYAGLITPVGAGDSRGGVTIVVAGGGAVTGRLILGGLVFRWRGVLDSAGKIVATLTRPEPLNSLTLALQLDESTGSISGSVGDGSPLANVEAGAVIRGGDSDEIKLKGRYTVALLPGDDAGNPQGYGFATLTVSKGGAARLVGTLADGERFSLGRMVTRKGDLPVYVTLYDRLGSLFGAVKFRETPAVSDADAILRWAKPELADHRFRAAFAIDLPLRAARFSCSEQTPLLPGLSKSFGQATLSFAADGESASSIPDLRLLVITNNLPVVFPPNEPKLTLGFSTRSGHWAGQFNTPDGGTHRFRGILYQKGAGCGYGFFLGATQSGGVVLEPRI